MCIRDRLYSLSEHLDNGDSSNIFNSLMVHCFLSVLINSHKLSTIPVSYTHLDVYKRQHPDSDPDDGEDDSWTETILTISVTGKKIGRAHV